MMVSLLLLVRAQALPKKNSLAADVSQAAVRGNMSDSNKRGLRLVKTLSAVKTLDQIISIRSKT